MSLLVGVYLLIIKKLIKAEMLSKMLKTSRQVGLKVLTSQLTSLHWFSVLNYMKTFPP